MSYNNIFAETSGQIATIVINRPKKLNSLNIETIAELHEAISVADNDNNIRAIIITGAGEKAFVAGADISEFANFTTDQGYDLSLNGHKNLCDFIENLSKPVIAAINGFALGGGLELAMSCHIRIASENAKMGLPEVSLGAIPGYGGTQRLPRIVGKGIALELLLSGKMISAEEAKQIGLANAVFPKEELILNFLKIAYKINKNSPNSLSHTIKTVNQGESESLKNALKIEANHFSKNSFINH